MSLEEFDSQIDRAVRTLRENGVEPTELRVRSDLYRELLLMGLHTRHYRYRGLEVKLMDIIDDQYP